MRGTRQILIMVFIVGTLYYVYNQWQSNQVTINLDDIGDHQKSTIESELELPRTNQLHELNGDLYGWIGKTDMELQNFFGYPIRKDISSYGYTWWVYSNNKDKHIQFGIENGKIETIFATGKDLSIDPIAIGQSYSDLARKLQFKEEVTLTDGIESYRFKLTDVDLKMRPLIQLSKKTFAQLYFDTFTGKLSSIRLLSKDVLLLQRPYEIFFRGDLPSSPLVTNNQWLEIEKGMEQQIFEITNVIRQRYNIPTLNWDGEVASVAFDHSMDMAINNYFSHYSLQGNGLKERLKEEDIQYFSAGENIAAQYTDGPAAVEGWLNSKGHREALLKNRYTHVGVGVYRYYYTQNFLERRHLE